MLPALFSKTQTTPLTTRAKRAAVVGVTALLIAVTAAPPAMAWGRNEQNFTAGVLATLLIGAIIKDASHPAPVVVQNPRPVYYTPAPTPYYGSAPARAFNSYSLNERRRIQSTLSAYGYYHSSIDGAFGPNTYHAVVAYARHTGKLRLLSSSAGSYSVFDGLLF